MSFLKSIENNSKKNLNQKKTLKKINKLLCVTHIKVTIKKILIPIRSYQF